MPSEEDRISNITGATNEMKVAFALLTPSFATLIAPGGVPSQRNLCVAGKSLTQEVIDRWACKVRLMNAYGPAEVAICFLMDVGSDTRAETIGYPLPNCSCWLVDSDNQERLVLIDAVGELVVTGPSLAREYLNDEARTKASFFTGLAWADSVGLKDRTLFKTVDLLRYKADAVDGSCDVVRRKDTQIKLHGQRIEAGVWSIDWSSCLVLQWRSSYNQNKGVSPASLLLSRRCLARRLRGLAVNLYRGIRIVF